MIPKLTPVSGFSVRDVENSVNVSLASVVSFCTKFNMTVSSYVVSSLSILIDFFGNCYFADYIIIALYSRLLFSLWSEFYAFCL